MSAALKTINSTLGVTFEPHFFVGGRGGEGGKTALPPLISDWEKLEPGNFIIMYTIMYAFKIYKKNLLTSTFFWSRHQIQTSLSGAGIKPNILEIFNNSG